MRCKNGVRRAFQASPDICSKIVDRTNPVLVSHEKVGESVTDNDGANPSSHKTLHSLLGRKFDQLCLSECDTADVCKNVVYDDQRRRHKHPNHAFKNVVHNEMALYND